MKEQFKEWIIEELLERGYALEEATELYEDSVVSKLILVSEEYVLHYNIETWVDDIIKNSKK